MGGVKYPIRSMWEGLNIRLGGVKYSFRSMWESIRSIWEGVGWARAN